MTRAKVVERRELQRVSRVWPCEVRPPGSQSGPMGCHRGQYFSDNSLFLSLSLSLLHDCGSVASCMLAHSVYVSLYGDNGFQS